MSRICIVLSAVLLCVYSAPTQEKWHRSEMKNPQVDMEDCGRYEKSMICDPNGILEPKDADQLDDLIETVANTTDCPCASFYCEKDARGYRIAVALVPHMRWDIEAEGKDRPDDAREEEIIDNNLKEAQKFAYTLLTSWSPGQCDEGVIIFYSLYDNVLYTMTGQQARKLLTDSIVGDVAIDHREHFSPAGGNIFEGLRRIVIDYNKVFSGNYKARKMSKMGPANPQAVVGSSAHFSLASVYMLCLGALLSLLMLC